MEALVTINSKGDVITTSLRVAEVFGRNHADVLRDIRNLHCSDEFRVCNFAECLNTIKLAVGESRQKYYAMTKDGFTFLAMGYSGEKAAAFKEMYISEFNKRESMLKSDDYILSRSQEILRRKLSDLESRIAEMEQVADQFEDQLVLRPAITPKLKLIAVEHSGKPCIQVRGLPTVAVNGRKARFWFNGLAIDLLGLSNEVDEVWIAFYQSEKIKSDWYVSVDKVPGAIPFRFRDGALLGHSKELHALFCSSVGIESGKATLRISKSHDRFFKIYAAVSLR